MSVTVPESRSPHPPLSLRSRLGRWDTKISPYVYIAPFFLLFGVVGLFPLGYTFVVSLNDWDMLKGPGDWIGWGNYATELTDPFLWNSIFNTFSIFLISAVPQVTAAIVIAAALDANLRAKTFWRISVILPYVVTPVAVALIFSRVFSEKYGLVNNVLEQFGFDQVLWKTDRWPGHIAIATMVNWRWTGYNALILLAAMQAVPRELYESAAIDGAGAVRRFFAVTVPGIRPTIIFVIVTATVGGLQIFTEPKLFNPQSATGGPQRQYQTTVLYLWDLAFNRREFGRAAAVAWILFFLIVGVGVINYLISKRIATADTAPTVGNRSRRRAARRLANAASGEGSQP